MSKPAPTTEFDEARRIIGMIKSVTNPREYMEIFNITIDDIKNYKNILGDRKNAVEPDFFVDSEE